MLNKWMKWTSLGILAITIATGFSGVCSSDEKNTATVGSSGTPTEDAWSSQTQSGDNTIALMANSTNITIGLRDDGRVDGDRVSLYVNSSPIIQYLTLTGSFQNYAVTLTQGTNTIEVTALNEGFTSINTLEIHISHVTRGRTNLHFSLDQNQIVTITLNASLAKTQVACGMDHTMVLKTDGTLWACGYNVYGQLGLGDTIDRHSLTQVGTDSYWQSVACGAYHTLAIKTDGTLWGWGFNNQAELGLGFADNLTGYPVYRWLPTQIGTDTDWQVVDGGMRHTLALKSDETLWAWGDNDDGGGGALGLSDNQTRYSPTQVGRETNWLTIAAGSCYSLALKTDGTLWVWGYNNVSQLGLGDVDNRYAPTRLGTDTNWQVITASKEVADNDGRRGHSLAIKTDGTLWGWGDNGYGQLGLNDRLNKPSPTQIGSDTQWSMIKTGYLHTFALKNDDTLWTWGDNRYEQLGLGDTNSRLSPTQVGTTIDWEAIFVSGNHGFARKTDGTLWAWGNNDNGQLGLGDTTGRSMPTLVLEQ